MGGRDQQTTGLLSLVQAGVGVVDDDGVWTACRRGATYTAADAEDRLAIEKLLEGVDQDGLTLGVGESLGVGHHGDAKAAGLGHNLVYEVLVGHEVSHRPPLPSASELLAMSKPTTVLPPPVLSLTTMSR